MFIGTTIGGYGGWWLGEVLGFEMMGQFLISGLGSVLGIVVVWKWLGDYL
jgi:hypothetical protein